MKEREDEMERCRGADWIVCFGRGMLLYFVKRLSLHACCFVGLRKEQWMKDSRHADGHRTSGSAHAV